MLEPLLTTVGVVLLLGGCTFATIGLIGLIIKPDLFEQLHVAGLLTGPGVILVLLASVATGSAHTVTSAVLVVGFVLLTSSISTHVIAQAGARRYAEAAAGAGAEAGAGAAAGAGTAAGFTAGSSATSTDPLLAAGTASVPRLLTAGMEVLVAHDASQAAALASQLVAAIDWPAGSVIRLVRAENDEIGSAPSPAADLDEAARLLERPGLEVETAILRGEAADTIVDDAVAFGADVLVIGARRRGLVRSVLGGSASGEILDRARCPVLVARSTSLRSVLLATDGSTESGLATDVVARWPIFDLARIHVVSVATDSRPAR
ncbi:MAG TPA: monovalent cation/H(+) antiporter subunit G, partial [Candidatus Limnocylindrales bacterium]|nr:monovalent cation/H(+) antiporter subunit G [Candidatus Limnocylindrales bacterium]